MSNRDLEFTLKFKNQAKAVLKQAQADLAGLGKTAQNLNKQLGGLNAANKVLATDFDRQAVSAGKAEFAQKRLELQTAKLSIAEQRLSASRRSLELSQQRLNLQTERMALQQQRFQAQQDRTNKSFLGMRGAVAGLAQSFVPLTAAAAAFGAAGWADEFALARARIQNATESAQEFDQVFAGLQQTARDTGSGMEPVISIFQRLSYTRKEIKATADEMLQFTDTVSKLGVISGASPDALKFGLTQLGQSLSSDIVRAEEFNSIMENIPAVGKKIADQFGVSTGQLRLLVIEGKVLSKDVFAALLNASEEVNAEFNKFPETMGRAFQGAIMDIKSAIGAFDEATGASGILIGTIYGIGKAVKAVIQILGGFLGIFSMAVKGVVGDIAQLVNGFLGQIENMVNVGITAVNAFRKEKIAPIDIAVDDVELSKAIQEDMKKSLDAANKAFKGGFETAIEAVGLTDKDAETAKKNSRAISQDYASIAAGLGKKKGKKDPAVSFYEDLGRQIEQLKEETYWVGKSNQARERATALLKVQQDAIKAGIRDFDPTQYMAAYDGLIEAQNRVHTDFNTGLMAAMQEFKDNAKGMGDLAQDVFKEMSDGISGTFRGLLDGTINTFDDLKASVGKSLANISGQIAEFIIQQQIMSAFGGSLFGMFGGGGGFSGAGSAGVSAGMSAIVASAKGNAYSNGNLQAFAKGGVVEKPMLFPTKTGMGLMGEAGTEGILPLKRLSNGVLGVQSIGNASSTNLNYSPTFQFTMENKSAGNAEDSSRQTDIFIKQLDNELKKTVLSVMDRELAPGGRLYRGR